MAAQYPAKIIEETAYIAYVRDTLIATHEIPPPLLPKFGTATEAEKG